MEAKPTRDACIDVFNCGVCQARYKLKKKYFDNVPANQVPTTSHMPQLSNEEWTKLVQKCSNPKNKVKCFSKLLGLVESLRYIH